MHEHTPQTGHLIIHTAARTSGAHLVLMFQKNLFDLAMEPPLLCEHAGQWCLFDARISASTRAPLRRLLHNLRAETGLALRPHRARKLPDPRTLCFAVESPEPFSLAPLNTHLQNPYSDAPHQRFQRAAWVQADEAIQRLDTPHTSRDEPWFRLQHQLIQHRYDERWIRRHTHTPPLAARASLHALVANA